MVPVAQASSGGGKLTARDRERHRDRRADAVFGHRIPLPIYFSGGSGLPVGNPPKDLKAVGLAMRSLTLLAQPTNPTASLPPYGRVRHLKSGWDSRL